MTTFKTNPVSLEELLKSIEKGKLQLPDFQRGWVWDDDRIKGLLLSILRGFPIGAIMTLDTGGDLLLRSRLIEGVSAGGASHPEQFLLDGQQRLTSLYQTLWLEEPVETRDRPGGNRVIKRCYYVDIQKTLGALDGLEDIEKSIVSVPEERIVRPIFGRDDAIDLSSKDREFESHMVPTEQVMNGMGWGFEYAQYWNNRGGHPNGDPFVYFKRFNDAVLENFKQYQLPVISLGKDTSKEAVCTVFEKVNTGGVTLSVFELVTATFAADDFSLRDEWAQRRERMHRGFGVLRGIEGSQFLQAVTLMVTQARRRRAISEGKTGSSVPGIDCRRDSILSLKLDEYREWADRTEEGFRSAAKFLHTQFIFTDDNVPYNTQLVPLASLYVELGAELEPSNAREKLERWFWSGIFNEAYGGTIETQFARDLAQVAGWVRGGTEPDLLTQANFSPERLLRLSTRISAAYKGLYALQMKKGAADWSTAEPLTITDFHDKPIDIHHIFPKHWCENEAKPRIPRPLYDSIINKTPIDAITNRKIGGRAPSDYLPILRKDIEEEKLSHILEAHWIKPEDLWNDRFAEHFVERGQAMFDLINQTIGKPVADHRDVFRNKLAEANLIAETDDEDIEHDPIGESTDYSGLG